MDRIPKNVMNKMTALIGENISFLSHLTRESNLDKNKIKQTGFDRDF